MARVRPCQHLVINGVLKQAADVVDVGFGDLGLIAAELPRELRQMFSLQCAGKFDAFLAFGPVHELPHRLTDIRDSRRSMPSLFQRHLDELLRCDQWIAAACKGWGLCSPSPFCVACLLPPRRQG